MMLHAKLMGLKRQWKELLLKAAHTGHADQNFAFALSLLALWGITNFDAVLNSPYRPVLPVSFFKVTVPGSVARAS